MKLQVNDLRIGNWVEYNGVTCQVYGIHSPMPRKEPEFDGKVLVDIFYNSLTTVTLDEIKPIALNEEVLLKFGFRRVKYFSYEITLGALPVEFRNYNDKIWYLSVGGGEIYMSDRVKYVHEYQNLHHVMTGREAEYGSFKVA